MMEAEQGIETKSNIAQIFYVPLSKMSTWIKNKNNIIVGYQKYGPKQWFICCFLHFTAGNYPIKNGRLLYS